MADPVITNIDNRTVLIQDAQFNDEVITFAGADTFAEGTVMARITATDKVVPWDSGGAAGTEIPKGVLTFDLVATGAGDVSARMLVGGVVREELLLEDGVGTANIDKALLDKLRDFGIIALSSVELGGFDNA